MDARLAEIYGTNEDVSDLEKSAAAELAEKLAEGEEMNLDGLSDEDIESLAQEVLASNEEQAEEETEEEATEEEPAEKQAGADETEEKLAEADYIGRVMAHAYVNELKSIDKAAGAKEDMKKHMKPKSAENPPHTRMEMAKFKAKDLGEKAKAKAQRVGTHLRRAGNTLKAGITGHYGDTKYSKLLEGGHHLTKMQRGKILGKAGAGAAAIGAAGYGAKKLKEKMSSAEEQKASALDTLAEQRALEILKENGVELESQEKQAGGDKWDVLAQAVEARAMEMLEAEGYAFEDGEEEAAE